MRDTKSTFLLCLVIYSTIQTIPHHVQAVPETALVIEMSGRRYMAIASFAKPFSNVALLPSFVRRFYHSRWLASSHLETEVTAPNGTRWTQPLGLFINNQFSEGVGGDRITTINPYTEKDICSVFAAGEHDVNRAVRAARKALKQPAWRLLSGTERGRLMNRLADLVEEHGETLAAIETLDNGKPVSASRSFDVPNFSEVLRYYAGWADKNPGSVIDVGPKKMAYTVKQPVGVCGQIIPWNYPLEMAAWKLGPALSCGNTVVLKLAEQTPLSMLYVAKLVHEAGFPPGVINIINGRGGEAGAALARHPDVDKIAFTGSTATGKEVMRMAAGTLKAVTLETGGKSPLIVFDDANLEQAVRWAHEGVMANQGQVCTATSRLLVQDGIYDSFVERFKAFTEETSVLGDPFDPKTYQGPQVGKAEAERIMSYISSARNAGADVFLARQGSLPSKGYFTPPTVLTNVGTNTAAFREEIFGPVAVVARFSSEEEAIEIANATRYGLAGAVFTRDLGRAHRVARDLEAGMVWVNSSNDSDVRVPFGGVKESGLGRELGEDGLRGYYTVKAVHVNLTDE
ncbi:aldehyde dehydrogenase [Trichoderma ceciliae]